MYFLFQSKQLQAQWSRDCPNGQGVISIKEKLDLLSSSKQIQVASCCIIQEWVRWEQERERGSARDKTKRRFTKDLDVKEIGSGSDNPMIKGMNLPFSKHKWAVHNHEENKEKKGSARDKIEEEDFNLKWNCNLKRRW